MRLPHTLFAAGAVLLLGLTPALAATARASGNLPVRSGPGSGYRVIDHLQKGERVELAYCTRSQRWCELEDGGWVQGTYLVGSGAKAEATPFRFLVNPEWVLVP